jgi:hypothetical protein
LDTSENSHFRPNLSEDLQQCVTVPVPPLVMEMQTDSINNHISLIFFVLAVPMYWWDLLSAPVLMVRYKGDYSNRQVDD